MSTIKAAIIKIYSEIIVGKKTPHSTLLHAALLFTSGTSIVISACAEEGAALPLQKWRPKDGIYLGAKTNPLYDSCGQDFGNLRVELAKKLIGGNEWNCTIGKLTDIAPGTIKLDAICIELQEKPYKSIITLKRIDESTFVYHSVVNGISDPEEKMSYCPEDKQQIYRNAQIKKQN